MKHTFKMILLGFSLSIGLQYAAAQSGNPPPGSFSCPVNGKDLPDNQGLDKLLSCSQASPVFGSKYERVATYVPTNEPVKTIRIALHFFQNSSGGNMWQDNAMTLTMMNNYVNTMNYRKEHNGTRSLNSGVSGAQELSDSKIRFEITGLYFYQNNAWNTSTDPAVLEAAVASQDPGRLNSLPIYFTAGFYGDAGGMATFPSGNMAFNSWVMMFNNGFTSIGPLEHELGHSLFLFHTYDGNVSVNDPDYLSDVHNVSWKNYCSPPAGYVCPHVTGWNIDPNDQVSHPYTTNNLMGGCLYNQYTSALQMGRMHRTLALYNVRKYVKELTSESNYPLNITADETWDFDIQLYRDIVVKPGKTLTIKCRVGMANNGRIIVERGARLIIDGGEVYAWGTSWEGVQVWGTSSQRQIINSNGLSTYQGIVKVINEGTLRDAKNAIVTTKANASREYDWNGYFGGIIQCDNAKFINNRVSVAFMTHHNYISTTLLPNQSYIIRSLFEVNNDMAVKDPADPYLNTFVSLWNVEGVKLQGNFYQNICNPLPAIGNRGYGVVSYDGSFNLDRYKVCGSYSVGGCTSYSTNVQSKFLNLNYGVSSQESNPLGSITVNDNDFINCNRGVYMSGTHNMKVTGNRISVDYGGNTNTTYPYGIYLESSTAYDVSNNVITTHPGSFNNRVTGIFVNHRTGYSNMIYRNKMDLLNVGITVTGDNRGNSPGQGLQLRCNDFGQSYLNYQDIWLNDSEYPWGNSGRIDVIQGNATIGANNRFSHNTGGFHDFLDVGASQVDYYYNPDGSLSTTPLYHSPTLIPHANLTAFDQPTMCPEFRNATSGGLHQRLIAIAQLDAGSVELKALIDNHNTAWLIAGIRGENTATPAEIKAALVSASPYLSDEVLIEAFTSPLLTNDNIASLHKKNAPVTAAVWNVLTGLNLPKVTQDKLNKEQSRTTPSGRAVLEADIAEIEQEKAFEIDEGLKAQLNDSLGSNQDSLLPLLLAGTDVLYNNRVAAFYVATNQAAPAAALFNSLRDPNGQLSSFLRMQEIVLELKQTDRNVFTLLTNTGLREEVEAIADDLSDPAYAHAQSLLSLVFGTHFEEFVELPGESTAIGLWNGAGTSPNNSQKMTANVLLIFPNPSNGNTFVSCVLETEFTTAELVVYDVSGNRVMSQALQQNKPGTELATEELRAGIYFIHLLVDGQHLETQKFVKH